MSQDLTRVNEIQDKILQAIGIVNSQALASLQYDKTIVCTIVNDKDRKEGKYDVSDGAMVFTAYSTDIKLRKNNSVYVTIPQGNYENQKIIIGKKITETEKPFVFTQPFDTIFDMTDNLIIDNNEYSLLANEENNVNMLENTNYIVKQIGSISSSDRDISNYTRLGLKAKFKSWLKEAVTGNYGIVAVLTINKPGLIDENPEDIKIEKRHFYLSASNMYGNPYNFETYYEQQIVIPLESVEGNIIQIDIYFYQEPGTFKDKDGKLIPYIENETEISQKNEEVVESKRILDNLFIKDVYLCFGYDVNIFTKDFVEIYTQDKITYRRSTDMNDNNEQYKIDNQKELRLRWVHVDENGEPINMSRKEFEGELPYEIRWYKYTLGADAADEYSSVYWERIITPIEAEWKQKLQEVMNDTALTEEERNIKLQEINNLYSVLKSKENFIYIFNPNVQKQQEKVKAIIVYNDNTPYRSNVLTFENEEEMPSSDSIEHIKNALRINVDDGTNGNYMIYNQTNDIKDSKYSQEIRTLSCSFDVNGNGEYSPITDYNNIVWKFPKDNSMLKLQSSHDNYIVRGEQLKYSIERRYSAEKTNNTIVCQYILNGVTYSQAFEFTFGHFGTMGTAQTLVVDFADNKRSICVGDQFAKLQVRVYDESGKEIPDMANSNIKWSWKYRTDRGIEIKNYKDEDANVTGGSDTDPIVGLYFPLNRSFDAVPGTSDQHVRFGQTKTGINGENELEFIPGLYIIKVKVGELETYFPIPICDQEYSQYYIQGAKEILYQTSGEIHYSQMPYKMFDKDGQEQISETDENGYGKRKFCLVASKKYYYYTSIPGTENNTVEDEEQRKLFADGKLYRKRNNVFVWQNPDSDEYKHIGNYTRDESQSLCSIRKINNIDIEFIHVPAKIQPNDVETLGERVLQYLPQLNEDVLKPLQVYIEGAPQFGVAYYIETPDSTYDGGFNRQLLYIQPIVVFKNKWPSSTINNWDGTSLEINKENGQIVATAIAAGKKHSEDNTFSGVMLGDWQELNKNAQTGIYGFHHGEMSYAFKDDGTAFLGKDGRGRIHFDGNESAIYSANWNNGQGMKIDLDEPYIAMQDQTNKKSGYPLQIGDRFKVDWQGNTTIYKDDGKPSAVFNEQGIEIYGRRNNDSIKTGKIGYAQEKPILTFKPGITEIIDPTYGGSFESLTYTDYYKGDSKTYQFCEFKTYWPAQDLHWWDFDHDYTVSNIFDGAFQRETEGKEIYGKDAGIKVRIKYNQVYQDLNLFVWYKTKPSTSWGRITVDEFFSFVYLKSAFEALDFGNITGKTILESQEKIDIEVYPYSYRDDYVGTAIFLSKLNSDYFTFGVDDDFGTYKPILSYHIQDTQCNYVDVANFYNDLTLTGHKQGWYFNDVVNLAAGVRLFSEERFVPTDRDTGTDRRWVSAATIEIGEHSGLWITDGMSTGNNKVMFEIGDPDGDDLRTRIRFYRPIDMKGNVLTNAYINNNSDYRLKTNIIDPDINAVQLLNEIELKSYDWIKTGKHENLGVIAQQAEMILPEVIGASSKGGIKTISYMHFIPYLIKAVQEISQKLDMVENNKKVQWKDDMTEEEKRAFIEKTGI